MFKNIKNFYNAVCENGIKLPFAYDSVSKLPSVTLFFSYVTFVIMIISLICLHFFKQVLEATLVTVFVWVLSVVFYRLRELDKLNINLKTGSIGLEDDNISKEKEDNETK